MKKQAHLAKKASKAAKVVTDPPAIATMAVPTTPQEKAGTVVKIPVTLSKDFGAGAHRRRLAEVGMYVYTCMYVCSYLG